MVTKDNLMAIYAGLLLMMFMSFFLIMSMSFAIDESSLLGPGALVIGMVGAILWLVKRDKELREQITRQNDKIIEQQNARIKELETEIKELRNN